MIVEIVKEVLKGLISGGVASLLGYAKQENPEKWRLDKFAKTVILGSFTGAIVRGSGMPIPQLATEISNWLITEGICFVPAPVIEMAILTGLIMIVDQLVKIIVRRTDIVKVWNKLKEFLGKYWYSE